MKMIKNIISMFTIPISSRIGYMKLKKQSLKTDLTQWHQSFHNKNILIVGSGPSLDKVDQEYYSRFDVVLYINHAIKLANKAQENYFFTTDIGVALNIYRKPYFSIIKELKKDRSIVAPGNFNQSLFLSKKFEQYFSWICAGDAEYKKFQSRRKVVGIRPTIFYYRPINVDNKVLDKWYSEPNQLKYFPVFEITSALTAINFVAKYLPKSITLIGCDFSSGRAKKIIKDNNAYNQSPFNNADKLFYSLKEYLQNKGVVLENDSWKL